MAPPPVAERVQVNPPHWGYWLAGALVLLAGAGAISLRFHRKPPYVSPSPDSSVAAEVRLRRSVAILGFRNLPGRAEDAWLSPVFAEMLDTELGTRGDLRMIPAEDIDRMKRELPPMPGDTLSKATLEHLHNNPGADVVILGSYTPMPGKDETRIRLDVRAQDTADGETIAEEAITGDENNLFDLAARAGTRLRQRLGLPPNSQGDVSAARLALPANERAARLYVDGRAKLWAFEFLTARDVLVQAVAADNSFPARAFGAVRSLVAPGVPGKGSGGGAARTKPCPGAAAGRSPADRGPVLASHERLAQDRRGLSGTIQNVSGQSGLRFVAGYIPDSGSSDSRAGNPGRAAQAASAPGK